MKKRMIAGMAAAFMIVMTPETAWCAGKAGQNEAVQEGSGYEFLWNDTRITMGQNAKELLKTLGKAASVFEQDSCAYQGKDRVYSYGSFELSTYPVGKEEHVSSIYLLDNKAETEEGIKIGSTSAEMVKAYGTGYQEENEVYRYAKDGMELVFYITDHKVDGIEYILVDMQ